MRASHRARPAPRRRWTAAARWGAVAGCLLVLAGCSSRPDRLRVPPPAAYHPDRFPDIPLPPGYVPSPEADHLAVSYGGGALRRYHTVLHQVLEDSDLAGGALLDWYARRLPQHGWELTATERDAQVWRRENAGGVGEELRLETGRAHRRPIMRATLVPVKADAPAQGG